MQLQHLKPGHMFELGTGEIVRVDDIQHTEDGLVMLQLTMPGSKSWSTAAMRPTAIISGGLVQ